MAEKESQGFDAVLSAVRKKFSVDIGALGDVVSDTKSVSSGNMAIDHILGVGGIPFGRSCELYGPASSGKTTTALQSAATLQKIIKSGGDPARGIAPDDRILYVDFEQAIDPTYCQALGLDLSDETVLFFQPESFEQAANVVRELLATGKVRMFILDSVASLVSETAISGETGKAALAMQSARLMAEFMRTLNPLLRTKNCAALFINHIQEKIQMNGRPGMPAITTTPGGSALKFYASIRVEYKPTEIIRADGVDELTQEIEKQEIARNVKVRVVKNKVASPFKTALVRVAFGTGFSNGWSAVQVLLARKALVYSSGYYYFEKSPELITDWMTRQSTGNKRPYIRGESSLMQAFTAHPEWVERLVESAQEFLYSGADVPALEDVSEASPEDHTDADPDLSEEGAEDKSGVKFVSMEELLPSEDAKGTVPFVKSK